MEKGIPFYKSRTQIEAIKLALKTLGYSSISLKRVVEECVDWLLIYYQETENEDFLISAMVQIIAWLELGFEYEQNREPFDRVLQFYGIDRNSFLSEHGLQHKRVRLSKNRIRTIIGRWRRGVSSDLQFDAVINDIYERMSQKKNGRTEYVSHYSDGGIFSLFEVIVSDKEYILHDMLKEKYYFFEVSTNDSCGDSG